LYVYKQQQKIGKPLADLFPFFEKPENLSLLTPKWLSFKIKSKEPLSMKEGARFEYTIKLFGIPMHWETLITKYEPPFQFVDEQLKGPYKVWIHTHSFIENNEQVLMTDEVKYDLYGGFLKGIINHFFIKHSIKQIFRFRKAAITEFFNL